MRAAAFLGMIGLAVNALSARGQETTAVQAPQVSGYGTVEVVLEPKSALVLVGLSGEGPDAERALLTLQDGVEQIRAALEAMSARIIPWGVGFGENQNVRRIVSSAQADITTSKDYLARAGVAVQIADLEQLLPVVMELAKAGVGNINGIIYSADEADPEYVEAATRATQLARQKAEAIAAAAGGRLGEVVRLSPAPAYTQNSLARFNWADGSGVPLNPSEIVVRITVHGTWEFVPR